MITYRLKITLKRSIILIGHRFHYKKQFTPHFAEMMMEILQVIRGGILNNQSIENSNDISKMRRQGKLPSKIFDEWILIQQIINLISQYTGGYTCLNNIIQFQLNHMGCGNYKQKKIPKMQFEGSISQDCGDWFQARTMTRTPRPKKYKINTIPKLTSINQSTIMARRKQVVLVKQ